MFFFHAQKKISSRSLQIRYYNKEKRIFYEHSKQMKGIIRPRWWEEYTEKKYLKVNRYKSHNYAFKNKKYEAFSFPLCTATQDEFNFVLFFCACCWSSGFVLLTLITRFSFAGFCLRIENCVCFKWNSLSLNWRDFIRSNSAYRSFYGFKRV